MCRPSALRRALATAAALTAAAALIAGCGSSSDPLSTVTDAAAVATTNAAGVATTTSAMSGMSMSGSGKAVDGIKPIPTRTLGTATWQHMKIQAMAMTAIPFVIFDGTRERTVKVPKHASFHLMVNLTDARSHYPIPYAGVWATVRKAGKVVYDERQWPMISEYLGPHYGNDVELPGAGHYEVTLLISPPVSARHVEYRNVWLKPHRVSFAFDWKGTT